MEPVSLTSVLPAATQRSEAPRNATSAQVKTIVKTQQNFVDRLIAVRRHYVNLRGGFKGNNHRTYPLTTNADVKQLATLWSKEVSRVKTQSASDRTDHKRWRACVAVVANTSDPAKPNEVYPKNEAFWVCSARTAIYLESRKVRPSTWTLVRESIVESVLDLPTTIGDAAGAVANTASDAAGAVAGALSMPAKIGIAALAGIALGPPLIRAVRK